MMEEIKERLTKQEVMLSNVIQSLELVRKRQTEIQQEQHNISNELTKYKGFVGGMAFFITSVATAVALFFEYLGSKQ